MALLPSFDLDTVTIHDTYFSDEESIRSLPQEVLAGLAKYVNTVPGRCFKRFAGPRKLKRKGDFEREMMGYRFQMMDVTG